MVLFVCSRLPDGTRLTLLSYGIEPGQRPLDSEEDNALMRKFAAEAIVLLKNDKNVLTLNAKTLKKVAIVGGNAKALIWSGGGSAALKFSYIITPYDDIVDALKKVNPISKLYIARMPEVMPVPQISLKILSLLIGNLAYNTPAVAVL